MTYTPKKTFNLRGFCKDNNLDYRVIYSRIHRGATFEEAIQGNFHERKQQVTAKPSNPRITGFFDSSYAELREKHKNQVSEITQRFAV